MSTSAESRGSRSGRKRCPVQWTKASEVPIPATVSQTSAYLVVSVPVQSKPLWLYLAAATVSPRSLKVRASSMPRVVFPDFLGPMMETAFMYILRY